MIVATHDGSFHADDVFAVATLRAIVLDIEIVRTRDPRTLAAADLRVDVGGRYEPGAGDFDHHQRDGARAPRKSGLPFAAFGLVWLEYGTTFCGGSRAAAETVDETFVQLIDAHDNGVETYSATAVDRPPVTVSHVIGALNASCDAPQSHREQAFVEAVGIAARILDAQVERVAARTRASAVVRAALSRRRDPRILELDRGMPWGEEVARVVDEILFVMHPTPDGTWLAQAVPDAPGSFTQKHPFPAAWAGLAGGALGDVSGVADAVFCHAGRFLVVAGSRAGADALVKKALEHPVSCARDPDPAPETEPG